MGRPGVMVYFDLRPCLNRLSLREKGMLFDAILAYGQEQKLPEFRGALGVAWDFVQPDIDRDNKRYDQIVEKRREAGRKGGAVIRKQIQANASADQQTKPTTTTTTTPTTTTTTTTTPTVEKEIRIEADKPPAPVVFSPPEVKEVRAYCEGKGYHVDPETFVDYYTANGWMVGRNRMKDWKAAVRRWERKENANGKMESKPQWTVGTVV